MDEFGSLKGTGSTVGDLRGISGQSIEELTSNIPSSASVRKLSPAEGGSQVGVEYKWVDENGVTNRMRMHDPDPSAPIGSNSAEGWVARWQKGKEYYDPVNGNFAHKNSHNIDSPHFNSAAANNTHIPIKSPDDWLINIMKYGGKNDKRTSF